MYIFQGPQTVLMKDYPQKCLDNSYKEYDILVMEKIVGYALCKMAYTNQIHWLKTLFLTINI